MIYFTNISRMAKGPPGSLLDQIHGRRLFEGVESFLDVS